jgi:hypothetical protein
MPLPIQVDGYSGFKANERPQQFQVDEDDFEIAAVEDRWFNPDAEYFKVRTTDGKRYILRYNERADEWSLQSGFDGAELFARPSIELVTVGPAAIRNVESQIAGCEKCRPNESQIPLNCVLADMLDKRGAYEFVLTEVAHCPRCRASLSEQSLAEVCGGIEVDVLG